MTGKSELESVSAANKVKLAFAWTFVSVPLIWGVYNTLAKAALLFQ